VQRSAATPARASYPARGRPYQRLGDVLTVEQFGDLVGADGGPLRRLMGAVRCERPTASRLVPHHPFRSLTAARRPKAR
jgi:hypothetical protein